MTMEADQELAATYDPANTATWANASLVATKEAEVDELSGVGVEALRGEYRINSPERLREYDEAKQWLADNPRFDAADCDTWPLPGFERGRASKLQSWLASFRISSPATWIVPAEKQLAYLEFMDVDLTNYRTFADDVAMQRLDDLSEDPGTDDTSFEREVAKVRAGHMHALQQQHAALWQAAVDHRSSMVREFDSLSCRAQRAFLEQQQHMTATIAEIESTFLGSLQERVQEKLSGLGADAQAAFEAYVRAAEVVSAQTIVEEVAGPSLR